MKKRAQRTLADLYRDRALRGSMNFIRNAARRARSAAHLHGGSLVVAFFGSLQPCNFDPAADRVDKRGGVDSSGISGCLETRER